MKLTKATLVLVWLILINFVAKAQMIEPVNWSYKSEQVGDNEYKISIIASIEAGWYMYSQDLNTETPVPTRIQIENNTSVSLEGKTLEIGSKKDSYDSNFHVNVKQLSGRTVYVQRIKVAANTPSVKGSLRYMTCNGQMCMPPKKVDFTVSLSQ